LGLLTPTGFDDPNAWQFGLVSWSGIRFQAGWYFILGVRRPFHAEKILAALLGHPGVGTENTVSKILDQSATAPFVVTFGAVDD
jgi:hypothetical protein